MSVVYEVTLDIDATIANEYRTWLNCHTGERFGDRFTATRRLLQPQSA